MNTLLIFFAFPIAVIIISAILQNLLRNPIAVASLIFAIFLIITFAFFDETFLIATLVYTLLAFLTALIVNILCAFNNNNNNDDEDNDNNGCTNNAREIVSNNLNTNTYGYRYNRYRRY